MIRNALGQSNRPIKPPKQRGVRAIPAKADPLTRPLVRDRLSGGIQLPTARASAGWRGADTIPIRPAHQEQTGERRTRLASDQANCARERHEQGGAEPDDHQGRPRTETVNDEPSGNHAGRVGHQERRIDEAHRGWRDAVLLHDARVAGGRDADAIEVAHECEGHEQEDDAGGACVRLSTVDDACD